MNECFYFHVIKNWKEDNGETELKQNAEWHGVRGSSPVEVQWAIRWVGQDLWWEGFVEHVCFKSGMEEKGSDRWCDGGDR